jgi:hypothetical protein
VGEAQRMSHLNMDATLPGDGTIFRGLVTLQYVDLGLRPLSENRDFLRAPTSIIFTTTMPKAPGTARVPL